MVMVPAGPESLFLTYAKLLARLSLANLVIASTNRSRLDMSTTNIHDAKSQLSKLIEEAEKGEEVIIARAGKPVAKIIAYKVDEGDRKGGDWKGKITIAKDFDVLPDEIASAFGAIKSSKTQK
jgi:prevent-host-death family protein